MNTLVKVCVFSFLFLFSFSTSLLNEICLNYDSGQQFAVLQPIGTGGSFMASKWLSELGVRTTFEIGPGGADVPTPPDGFRSGVAWAFTRTYASECSC